MKKYLIPFLVLVISSCQEKVHYSVTFSNPSENIRESEGIAIKSDKIIALREEQDSLLPVLTVPGGDYFPTQLDDLDGDGSWDELFTVVDLGPNESMNLNIKFIHPAEYPEFPARTNIRFADKKNNYTEVSKAIRQKHAINTVTNAFWQMEGIAFENELVGFRNYFDQRNAMDIFGKLNPSMILDSVGYKDFPDYHYFNPDWGMDVLKVGSSLGSGGIACLYNDSLFRVGDNGLGTCDIVTEGPLRSIFRLDYIDWSLDGTLLNVSHTLSIQSGTRFFESAVVYDGIEENIDIVAGIVNKKSNQLYEVDGAGQKVFFTHDLQSEDTTLLGMAIMIDSADYAGHFETPDEGDGITETYCVSIGAVPITPVEYRFYSAWEREDPRWSDQEDFRAYLEKESANKQAPVVVKFNP